MAALVPHLQQEVLLASYYLDTMTKMSEVLEAGGEPSQMAPLNEAAMSRATEMQQLFAARQVLLEPLTLAQALEQNPELVEIEAEHRALIEKARELNEQNNVIVQHLIKQTAENLQALEKASRQGGVYTAKGQSRTTSSRTIAAV